MNQGSEGLGAIHEKLVNGAGELIMFRNIKVGALLPPKMTLKNNDIVHRPWLVC